MIRIAILADTVIGLGPCLKSDPKSQPNILWLSFEDTSPLFIGCYGNETAHTPAITPTPSSTYIRICDSAPSSQSI